MGDRRRLCACLGLRRDGTAHLCAADSGPVLLFRIDDANKRQFRIEVAGIPFNNQWAHIATVTGKGGVRLYFNGTLIGTNEFTGSLSGLGPHQQLPRPDGLLEKRIPSAVTSTTCASGAGRAPRNRFAKACSGRSPERNRGWWPAGISMTARRATFRPGATMASSSAPLKSSTPSCRIPDLCAGLKRSRWPGASPIRKGGPVSGADVSLYQDGNRVAQARTELSGEYRLSSWPTGVLTNCA